MLCATGEWRVEVVPWRATQALRQNSERHSFSLAALGSEAVAHYSIAALLQPHNLARTGAWARLLDAPHFTAEQDWLRPDLPKPKVHMSGAEALLRITASARRTGGGGDDAYSSCTEVYLSEFKDAAVQDPELSASDFNQVTSKSSHSSDSSTTVRCLIDETRKSQPIANAKGQQVVSIAWLEDKVAASPN
jgi:hypothetical protein